MVCNAFQLKMVFGYLSQSTVSTPIVLMNNVKYKLSLSCVISKLLLVAKATVKDEACPSSLPLKI